MARPSKGEVNVSEAIRNFLETNKDVGPTAAAEAISKQVGKIVSPTYVSNIKSTMNRGNKKAPKAKKAGRKKTRVASVARASSNGTVELKTIAAVKELITNVGADKARQLIDLLA
jgi:hypothetical protein